MLPDNANFGEIFFLFINGTDEVTVQNPEFPINFKL